ncbi:MAG: hypothetical protein U0M15_06065 [Bacillota bacterium]|nr:hypothetical protein [Bacillota bacterium]
MSWRRHNLKVFYRDRFSLFRSQWQKGEDGLPLEVLNKTPLWEEVPCYLSMNKNSLGVAGRLDHPRDDDPQRNVEEQAFLLFCGRECIVMAGDILAVTHEGVTRNYVAGEPHLYPEFQEFLVYRREDA